MSNDAGNFLRKVVKFVANPTTDWAELDAPASDHPESGYAKAEIVERRVEALHDRGLVVWHSPRDGWHHLYLYDLATGQPRGRPARRPSPSTRRSSSSQRGGPRGR